MDRTAFAACVLLLAPVAVSSGCGVKDEDPKASPAPLVLAELQSLSPGPWRAGSDRVAPTSLERPVAEPPGATPLDRSALEELHGRMSGPDYGRPLQSEVVEPAPAPAPVEHSAAPVESQLGDAPSELRLSDPGMPSEAATRPDEESPLPDLGPAFVVPDSSDATSSMAPPPANVAEPRTLEDILAPPAKGRSQRLPAAIAQLPTERGQLPWSESDFVSEEMQAVLEQAEQRLREGFRLADRRALFLARGEFVGALELICQAQDLRNQTQFHTQALTAGLAALDESRDFAQSRPLGKQLDIARIVSGHRTKILSEDECATITPLVAAKRYYAFAQEQLAGAASGESRSSVALYGLGKLATTGAETSPAEKMALSARAMVLHQAALMADPANFRASNELGVLLARHGDYRRSRALFLHSVKISPHPSTYRNLVAVHTRLGEQALAQQAGQQALALERSGMRRNGPAIAWVDPVTFAGTAPPTTDTAMPPVAKSGTETPAAAPEKAPVETAGRGMSDWLPWKTKR